MKTYNEMADKVLCRIGEKKEIMRNRKKIITQTVTPALSLCLVALIGVGVWQGGLLEQKPTQAGYGGINIINSGTADDSSYLNSAAAEEQKPGGDIINIINIIHIGDKILGERENICLVADDRVEMTSDEFFSYYGIEVLPEIPDGLTCWEGDDEYNIYKRNGGKGEVYYDAHNEKYMDFHADYNRTISIGYAKGKYPHTTIVTRDYSKYKASVINGEKVYISAKVALDYSKLGESVINSDERVYISTNEKTTYAFAEFMYKGVGFHIVCQGFTVDEIVSVISSIIK